MARRRLNDNDARGIAGIITLFIFGLIYWIYREPQKVLSFIFLAIALILFILIITKKLKQNYRKKLFNSIKEEGQEEYIRNFINRFGLNTSKSRGWTFRGHSFDYERINDFEKVLMEHGIALKHTKNQKDIFSILMFYIQEKEENLTRESIKKTSQKFSELGGSGFEKLLYRLLIAMGYAAEWIGKSGDQGGDLIANKNGKRILIQAKCYRDWSTGNAAVQQVVGAMKLYDCSESMVISTSHFTKEAIDLARANNTELISKERLQELLLQYLGENWN